MQPPRPRSSRIVVLSLGALLACLAGLLAWRGWSFYQLPLEARPDHGDYRALRPGGTTGHGYGFAAALLVVTNLLYLVRRRVHRFRLGSMRLWLDLHVFTGLAAAVLVTFHTAFQLRSPLSTVTAISLAVVVATGIVGRLLHAILPQRDDDALGAAVDAVDQASPGSGGVIRDVLAVHAPPILPSDASLLRCLAALPGWRRAARARRRGIRDAIGGAPVPRAVRRRVLRLASADVRASGAAAFLRSWRSLHRLFALFMLATVAVHIAVAWHYGYRWVFG